MFDLATAADAIPRPTTGKAPAATVEDITFPTKETVVKLTVVRPIPVALAIALVAFVLSGVPRFKNAHHGVDAVIGEIVWLGFLIAALATLVLVAVALYRRRRRAVPIAGATLLALALAAAASSTPGSSLRVVLTHTGPRITGSTHRQAGPARIDATSQLADQEITLIRFRPGYRYANFLADGNKAQGHDAAARAAVRHVFAHTIFAGGIDLFRGQSASFTVDLAPGTYYLGEMTTRPQLTAIHVNGTRAGARVSTAATVTATDNGYRVSGPLPASGTIAYRNTGRRPHRLNLIPVKPGTTRAQLAAYIRKTGGRDNAPPPPFALAGRQIGTADLSPHQQMQLTYRLPAGTYAGIDFDQDLRNGRPNALEGLAIIVTLR